MIGMTSDAVPRFHRLAERRVTVCGFNGRGSVRAPSSAAFWPNTRSGGSRKRTCRCRSPTPEAPALPGLREAYYEAGAQIAHAAGGWM